MKIQKRLERISDYILIAEKGYMTYRTRCNRVAEMARRYITWDDAIGCEYFPGDGICITTSDAKVCPADSFFKFLDENNWKFIRKVDFERLCI